MGGVGGIGGTWRKSPTASRSAAFSGLTMIPLE